MPLLTAGIVMFATRALLAQDVKFIALLKGQHFEQTAPDLVRLVDMDDNDDNLRLSFTSFVQAMAPDVLDTGTLELPDHSSIDLTYDEEDQALGDEYGCETLFDLDWGRPNGDYTFSFETLNDGLLSVTLSLTNNAYPSGPPMITNFTALQAITNTAEAITLCWASLPGCTSNDYVKVVIEGPYGMLWQTAEFGQPGALNGTNTCVTLPPYTLSTGDSYDVEVMVARAVDIKTFPAMAVAAYYNRTDFEMHVMPRLPAEFDSSIPGMYGASVPVNSAISFRFTQPMNTGFMSVDWSGDGLVPSNFSYSWCDGNRVLMCSYAGDLPLNCDISWTLNLAGFKDALGNMLEGNAEGFFSTTADDDPMNGCFLFKIRHYRQLTATPVSMEWFDVEASVEIPAYNLIKPPATLAVSNHLYTLEEAEWDPELYLDASYTSQAQADAFFPNSSYTFTFPMLEGGTNTAILDLGSVEDYPAIPTITNLGTLQSINVSNDTVIAWTSLAAFSSFPEEEYNIIEVEICNEEDGEEMYFFEMDDPGITASSLTIPANTLWPGRTYEVNVRFTRIKDLAEVEGQFRVAGFTTSTELTIQTAGTPIMPAMNIVQTPGGIEISAQGGEPNRRYVMETSIDLQRWVSQFDFWADQMAVQNYQDPDAHYLPARFYRLRDWLSTDGWVQPPISIQGTVWTDSSRTTPLVGAEVGTDLDGQVTVTDQNGRFFLETESVQDDNELFYTITISTESQSQHFGPHEWGHHPRDQVFDMGGMPE
jgi:hypothetical protein